ncbi:DOLPP1 [Branchiostoma lanceolatum]|uniref:Dolichyldiphosphatase n=2 Tax=Branchiostoma lanceolatum TaxID=7740 RepID=A0A8K0ACK7_BRALA|nr:DOLPP1 [Branchiostoma lanceolatum]
MNLSGSLVRSPVILPGSRETSRAKIGMAAEGECLPLWGEENLYSDQNTRWKPISLTHVEYEEGDLLGKGLAWCSLTPVFILVGFGTLLLFRRELHTISFLAGILLNEAVNWVLKHLIREPRPCRGHSVVFSEYGMPSSHAQFMWFFSTYIVLFLYVRLHQSYTSTLLENMWKHLTAVGVFLLSMLVSYSRVYLRYHTTVQVAAGAAAGIPLGIVWFAIVQLALTPWFPMIAAWPICELFMVRDSTLIPNILWFEYTAARAEARTRHRKLGTKCQ